MLKINKRIVELIKANDLNFDLFQGQFGLEKENVRVNGKGEISLKPHPKSFGNKNDHKYITTDFSESQVEVITPPMPDIQSAYNMLYTLHNIVSLNLEDEYLWPSSSTPVLPEDSLIPLADYGNSPSSEEKNKYRQVLSNKYGRKKQLISGIHYNFSFQDDFLIKIYNLQGGGGDYTSFKNNLYLRMMRHSVKYGWLLIKLLGSSPVVHDSYTKECKSCSLGTSMRNGSCGYKNHEDMYVSMTSLKTYVEDINQLIRSDKLSSSKEYYNLIRPKNKSGEFDQLIETGIEYVELRLIDLNPLYKTGVGLNDLYLIHTFLILMALLEDESMDKKEYNNAMVNNRAVADCGRHHLTMLTLGDGLVAESEVALDLIVLLRSIAKLAPHNKSYLKAIEDAEYRMMNTEHHYSHRIYKDIMKDGYVEYNMNKVKTYLKDSKDKQFNFIGYEDMELSTQILILDALKRGVSVDILDRSENFIALEDKNHLEVVKQATKTSKDNYSSVLVMENKAVTKKILQKSSIRVADGEIYDDVNQGVSDYKRYENQPIVIKPNSTNFGIGITIFTSSFSQEAYEQALKLAFEHDSTILIEPFVEGKEYRIFVIGDEVVAAMHRVPANVTGDGVENIEKLIQKKNDDPLRGTGYRKPLQKINVGKEEAMFLSQSNRNFQTVPQMGEKVYLRENSNISTGGDSIDITDLISERYKKIAIEASKAVGATVVGVDLITKNIGSEENLDYAIIELNFNPAIHIHCFPHEGENRKLGDKILDHLGF